MMSTTSEMAKSMYMNRKTGFTRSREEREGRRGSPPRHKGTRGNGTGQGGKLARMGPGFHAQVVDFPHPQVRISECGVRRFRKGDLRALTKQGPPF